jgi:hypothetical protein
MHRVAVLFVLGLGLLCVAPQGVSAKPGQACRITISGSNCGIGEVCDPRPGYCFVPVRIFGVPGTCTKKRRICARVNRPICGCDGVTYPNDCQRLEDGVAKLHNGRC